MRKVGYARVSTAEQNLDTQIKDLYSAGCEKVFFEKISGVATVKPELEKALRSLEAGDTLMVWKLDRLGRRTIELLSFLEDLNAREISFQSITDGLDATTGPIGKLILMILSAFAELERDLIKERTLRGLEAAWASGKRSGPKEKVSDDSIRMAMQLLETLDENGKPRTGAAVAKTIGLSRSSLYRRIDKLKSEGGW
ncbi:recombinase family protein [Kiloniella laminariae]|uniref:Recombinase family protein n=1 Tax=Kiloniella laminariae TaxID=454162 RepID=A0ABT4LPU2_9PROT|nr:recombinase family protein [Kiloniella laminariae]MCZ4283160.1 recombinase family protein [Kiloniella laminariae]